MRNIISLQMAVQGNFFFSFLRDLKKGEWFLYPWRIQHEHDDDQMWVLLCATAKSVIVIVPSVPIVSCWVESCLMTELRYGITWKVYTVLDEGSKTVRKVQEAQQHHQTESWARILSFLKGMMTQEGRVVGIDKTFRAVTNQKSGAGTWVNMWAEK